MDIITIASKLHPTIWGVIIGSSLTLFGTFIQGRFALKLLLKQKIIENDIKKEHREFELKKENYLNSIKTMVQLLNAFMDFTKPGRNYDDFGKEIQSLFVDLCTIDLVADETTLEPMHKFQRYYFEVIVELMTEKIPFESLLIDKNIKKNWYDYYSKIIDENISLINNNPHNGTATEKEYQEYLSSNYKEYSEQRNKYSDEITDLNKRLLSAELVFKRKAVEKILLLNQFFIEYIQFARNDIGLSSLTIDFTQVNIFHQKLRDTIEKTFTAVDKLSNEDEAREE